jgi:hypothetical protein
MYDPWLGYIGGIVSDGCIIGGWFPKNSAYIGGGGGVWIENAASMCGMQLKVCRSFLFGKLAWKLERLASWNAQSGRSSHKPIHWKENSFNYEWHLPVAYLVNCSNNCEITVKLSIDAALLDACWHWISQTLDWVYGCINLFTKPHLLCCIETLMVKILRVPSRAWMLVNCLWARRRSGTFPC